MSVDRGRVIVASITVIVLLALLGLYQLDPQSLVERPADQLYRIVQLFTAEGDWTAGRDLPVALELARFLAPIVTVGSLLLLFAEGIWSSLINARTHMLSDHIVIVGLSDAAMALVQDCREQGLRVVVIDRYVSEERARTCRAWRIPCFVGDARDAAVLTRAGTHRARCLLSFIGNDDDNVELSLRIQEQLAGRRIGRDPLKVIVQVNDMQLATRLESYPKFFDYPQQMEVRFFNLDEQAARELFSEYLPDVYADALGQPAVHIVILGYSQQGRHVLLAAVKHAHFGNLRALMVTVVTQNADAAREAFFRQAPEIDIAAHVRFVESELSPEGLRSNVAGLLVEDATMFVACPGSDTDNMSLALSMRQFALSGLVPNAPTMVALRQSRGLARLVEKGQGPEIPDGLYPFGTIDRLMHVNRVINEQVDEIAMGIHQNFIDSLSESAAVMPSHRPWSMLPEIYRNYNRAQADHIAVKLRAAGYQLVSSPVDFEFQADEVQRLSHMEKNRWNAERASMGWRYAEHRSDLARVHPGLRTWENTPDDVRQFDINAVCDLPKVMRERLGLGIARQVVIGITGHRAHRIHEHRQELETAVTQELLEIARKYPHAKFTVLSALADGSDRLVADLALKVLDANLVAALPLPYEIYKRSFGEGHSNEASNEEFQEYVGRAALYFEMPLRFGSVETLEREDDVGVRTRAQQYALAGAYVVTRAHELIAIWDGEEARGVGGTAEVVEWRRSGVVPEAYGFPGRYFAPVEMTPPRVVKLPDA